MATVTESSEAHLFSLLNGIKQTLEVNNNNKTSLKKNFEIENSTTSTNLNGMNLLWYNFFCFPPLNLLKCFVELKEM